MDGEPALAIANPLELDALLDLLAQRNPTLAQARARSDAALALVEEAESALAPRLDLSSAVLRSNAPSTFLFEKIDAQRLAAGTDFNAPGTFNATQAGLALSWNLWRGGQDRLARDGATQELAARHEDVRALESSLTAAALAAWLDVRAAQELLRTDEASVTSLSAQLADAHARVAAGVALRSDELSLSVRLAQARERALSTQRARRLAQAALRALLALDTSTPIEIAPAEPRFALAPPNLEAARAEARHTRAELRALDRRLASVDSALEAARRAWWPSLDAQVRSWAVDDHAGLDFGDPNVEARLALSWSLLDGGARRATIHGREAERLALASQRRALEIAIDVEVEAAWIGLEEALARQTVADGARSAADETLQLVESQFRAGSAPVTRFLEVEGDRTRAQGDSVRARIDVLRARVALAHALGRWNTGAQESTR